MRGARAAENTTLAAAELESQVARAGIQLPLLPANLNGTLAPMVASAGGHCESEDRPLSGKCTGCPPMYNGKLCATTTWYEDRTKGSCGCGDTPQVPANYWTITSFTAAMNTASMHPQNPGLSWCLEGCGCCYEICTTGGNINSELTSKNHQKCEVFKVTNRCADGWAAKRPHWCNQQMSWQECKADPVRCRRAGNTNRFGYAAHFDLQDAYRQVQDKLGWVNPEVTFEPVSCSLWKGPADAACPGCQRR